MKANHNKQQESNTLLKVFINKSKIHFESKSQQEVPLRFMIMVFINKSKIHFESKSQLAASIDLTKLGFYQ